MKIFLFSHSVLRIMPSFRLNFLKIIHSCLDHPPRLLRLADVSVSAQDSLLRTSAFRHVAFLLVVQSYPATNSCELLFKDNMTTGYLKPVVGDMARSILGLTNLGVSHISHGWNVF